MWWWTSDVVEITRDSARSFWRTGGSDTGYTEIGNNLIARCPVLRLFLRSDDVEVRGGVLDANGARVECDDEEKAALKGGAEQCWWVRWVCLNLHAWHDFTHAVATDGSLKVCADGAKRLWQWTYGKACSHLEMYAILIYLRKMTGAGRGGRAHAEVPHPSGL